MFLAYILLLPTGVMLIPVVLQDIDVTVIALYNHYIRTYGVVHSHFSEKSGLISTLFQHLLTLL